MAGECPVGVLDQAMEKLDDPELTRQLTKMLDQRLRDTILALTTAPHLKIEEYVSGWQDACPTSPAPVASKGCGTGSKLGTYEKGKEAAMPQVATRREGGIMLEYLGNRNE